MKNTSFIRILFVFDSYLNRNIFQLFLIYSKTIQYVSRFFMFAFSF